MPLTFPNIVRNITLLCAEGLGAGMVLLLGAACASFIAMPPLSAAIGYGIAVLVFTALLVLRTGAMLNTGATLLKVAMWIFGLDSRQYFTTITWKALAPGHGHSHVPQLVPWQWAIDIVMGALYMGFQIGGALLGVLLLREADRTGLLAGSVNTKPYGNLAGENTRAFLLAYVLNSFVLTVYGASTSNSFSHKMRQTLAPVAVGLALFVAIFVSLTFGVGSVLSFPSDFALAIIVPATRTRLWISATAQVGGALTAFMFCWWMNFLDRGLVHEIHTNPHMKAFRRAHNRTHKRTHKRMRKMHSAYHNETGRVIESLRDDISAPEGEDAIGLRAGAEDEQLDL